MPEQQSVVRVKRLASGCHAGKWEYWVSIDRWHIGGVRDTEQEALEAGARAFGEWAADSNAIDPPIYESEAIEDLAVAHETSADRYADAWLEMFARTPEMALDRETMLSLFAIAVEAGRAAGRSETQS